MCWVSVSGSCSSKTSAGGVILTRKDFRTLLRRLLYCFVLKKMVKPNALSGEAGMTSSSSNKCCGERRWS